MDANPLYFPPPTLRSPEVEREAAAILKATRLALEDPEYHEDAQGTIDRYLKVVMSEEPLP